MLRQFKNLPLSLRIVCWLQFGLSCFSLLGTVQAFAASTPSETLANILGTVLPILVVLGILQRSRFIRKLVLVLTCVGVLFYLLYLLIALITMIREGVLILIPLVISAVTIWGLNAREAKEFFRIA